MRGMSTQTTRRPRPGRRRSSSAFDSRRPPRGTAATVARRTNRSGSRQLGRSSTASSPSRKNSWAPGCCLFSSSSVSTLYEGPPRSTSSGQGVNAGCPSMASRTRASLCLAGVTDRRVLRHGSPAGTQSTRLSCNCSRARSASTKCPRWTGSNVPPRTPSLIPATPTRPPPRAPGRLAGPRPSAVSIPRPSVATDARPQLALLLTLLLASPPPGLASPRLLDTLHLLALPPRSPLPLDAGPPSLRLQLLPPPRRAAPGQRRPACPRRPVCPLSSGRTRAAPPHPSPRGALSTPLAAAGRQAGQSCSALAASASPPARGRTPSARSAQRQYLATDQGNSRPQRTPALSSGARAEGTWFRGLLLHELPPSAPGYPPPRIARSLPPLPRGLARVW